MPYVRYILRYTKKGLQITERTAYMAEHITEFWRRAPLDVAPYIHPEDAQAVKTFTPNALRDGPAPESEGQHLHAFLLPEPYVGNLKTADIFILSKNPGFDGLEYKWEENRSFFERKRRSVHQNFASDEIANYYLDPDLREHPGYRYWRRHLGQDIFSDLRHRFATLEIVSYHTAHGFPEGLRNNLRSTQKAKDWVHDELVPRAKRDEILLIVVRQVQQWGFEINRNISNLITYYGGEPQGAYLTPPTRGGQAIREWLKRYPS